MKYFILFIYIAVNILLFFFNWDLFTTMLEFNLGFATFSTLPFLVLQIFGGFVISGYMIWDTLKDLKSQVTITTLEKKIIEFHKNNEIQMLKKNVKEITNTSVITEKEIG